MKFLSASIVLLVLGVAATQATITSLKDINWAEVRPVQESPQFKANRASSFVDRFLANIEPVQALPPPVKSSRINNGVVVGPTDVPYIVGVLVSVVHGTYFCGGVLVSRTHVLTSGTCVEGHSSITVLLGASDITRAQDFVLVEHVRVHPDFSSFFQSNDLAILTLSRAPRFGDQIQVARLPRRSQVGESFNSVWTTISGWGETASNTGEALPMQQLRSVRSQVISNFSCTISFPLYLRSSNVCTSSDGGAPCVGDEGGPVTVVEGDGQSTVIAIHSYTYSRGCTRSWPAVHTRVTDYLNWIEIYTGANIRA
ncbi:serine protease 1-like [Anopheles ziemanni]|uniref:serine protease 1-like n=1 Tax=Anopheles coustani TaxID=139045 RepID=UPI002659C606|nr:serine protease 1-like [Anopheles coustani]XP_058167120.1 serine protease 1-like [Anopheles ziemanni]